MRGRGDDLHMLARRSALAALYVTYFLCPVAGICENAVQHRHFSVHSSGNPLLDEATGTQTCNPAEGGFLFIGNQPISAPYVFRREAGQLYVNDIPLPRIAAAPARKRGGGELPPGERVQLHQFERQLHAGSSFLILPDQRPIRLDKASQAYSLLKAVRDIHDGREPAETDLEWLPLVMTREAWLEWLHAFEPTAAFLARATAEIEAIDRIGAANEWSNRVVRGKGTAAYMLTSLGMLVSVLSIGHLLSSHPKSEANGHGPTLSAEARGVLVRTLVLVAILAGFDLAWTLLGSKNSEITELNPFAGPLLAAPHLLIFFKAAATTLTIGLLFALKEHRLARLAAWWACLILTLVVLRWLTVGVLIGS